MSPTTLQKEPLEFKNSIYLTHLPSYSEDSKRSKTETVQNNDWLANSSYPTPIEKSDNKANDNLRESPSRNYSSSHKKKKKHEKKKKKKSKSRDVDLVKLEEPKCIDKNENFFIDKERQSAYATVKTLPKTMRPRYHSLYPGLFPVYSSHSKSKIKRYFKSLRHFGWSDEGSLEGETLAGKKIEEFNKKITEKPSDIETWIEFVNFQDEFYKHQHIKYRTSIERDRAAAHHKLSILDKAVAKNPSNKDLQELWLKIGTTVLPSEEMSKRIDSILEESGGTMTLWLGLMTTTQYSLARCTVPSVSSLFEKLLVNFQNVKFDSSSRDKNVLELLFHYGRFLDNCGQWETLWTIIKVNLQFNTRIQLNIDIEVDSKVRSLEDEIVKQEKRGVWQLWSQMERIREGYHFLPDENSVDYPQRCVAPENVVNFTWHFHPELHFQVMVSFIVLMKVPLLPSTHTILKLLTPNSLPWIFDSPEYILSSVFISPAFDLQHNYLSPLAMLTRGPQYLTKAHGQEEFLNLISFTFEACLKILEGRQKTALGVWWLRFERWINLLNQVNLAGLPDTRKSAKKFFKEFLAVEENRDNLLFYTEYCLLQHNQGNTEACLKALKTLISSRPPVLTLMNEEEKATLTFVYRTLCEVLVGKNQKREALNLLINLGNGSASDDAVTIHYLVSAEKKFKQLTVEMIEELNADSEALMENFLMPSFQIDWISCYLWLIALTKSSGFLKTTYDELFQLLEAKNGLVVEQIRECLVETILTITWTFERNNLLYVNDILQKSYSAYPKNFKILNFMADHSIKNSRLWLSIRKTFLSPPSTISCLFLICVALERFYKDKANFQNRMKNLFQDLALKDGKLSPLLHCLRLRYLYEYDNTQLEVAQLQALESCPWSKSIYMESILLLPGKLMQLTDVLVEKELKIHITPDEIQEMRD